MERTTTTPPLRALLTGLIDYAGLFPPAELSMADAVRHYTADRGGPNAWMLASFICPAARLSEFAGPAPLFARPPVPFAAILRGGQDTNAFMTALDADAADIDAFERAHEGAAAVTTLEGRVPETIKLDIDAQAAFHETLHARTHAATDRRLFLEVSRDADWNEAVATTVDAIARENLRRAEENRSAIGLKVRCGGVTADAFPETQDIAFAIAACRNQRVPIKFTAGLHHPFRRYDSAIDVTMHGFVNVFVAATAAFVHGLTVDRTRAILNDEEVDHFTFDADALSWKGYRLLPSDIEDARRRFAVSYGSCSFDEPVQDLTALGLL